MKKNTGTQGASRPHIDTLHVVFGHALTIEPTLTVVLGGGRREREAEIRAELDGHSSLPAGRGR